MNMELIDVKKLLAQLKGRLSGPGRSVSIDGVTGAGQEALADTLAAQCACDVIEVDTACDAAKLRIELAAKQKKRNVVVSGVLMRQILTAAGIKPDISIYVVPSAENNRRGFWEGILSKSLPEYLAELKTDLDKKTVEYHWKYHPIINADYLVEGD
jgi:hypothetical protein